MSGAPCLEPELVGLAQAHGEMRDALGAITGFSTLLRSPKVGPRTLEGALDDVLHGCGRLDVATQRCVALIEASLGASTTGDLLQVALARSALLQAKATRARPMNAARRIDLEQTMLTTVPDLEACLMLIDLLKEATTSNAISVDLTSLLNPGRGSDPDLQPTKRTVLAQVNVELSQHEFQLKPRVAALVIATSVAFVTQDKHSRCCIQITDAAKGGFQISIARRSATPIDPPGREIEITVPRILSASESCCKTAARSSVAEVTWDHNLHQALLSWSAH